MSEIEIHIHGDSSLDNRPYINEWEKSTVDHFKHLVKSDSELWPVLENGTDIFDFSKDGDVCNDITFIDAIDRSADADIKGNPYPDVTISIVNVGGNDMLELANALLWPSKDVNDSLVKLSAVYDEFRMSYRRMLRRYQQAIDVAGEFRLLCGTIYYAEPAVDSLKMAVDIANGVIREEVARLPDRVDACIVDLNAAMDTPDKYSHVTLPAQMHVLNPAT